MPKIHLTPEQFKQIATEYTSNQMLEEGAWMAPPLMSTNPEADSRAKQAIHYYADETEMSLCGLRFLPNHYIETAIDENESRQRCTFCSQIENASRLVQPTAALIYPHQTEFTRTEFETLIESRPIRTSLPWQLNRLCVYQGVLHLMVDDGAMKTGTMRRTLHYVYTPFNTVKIVETPELLAKRANCTEWLEDAVNTAALTLPQPAMV